MTTGSKPMVGLILSSTGAALLVFGFLLNAADLPIFGIAALVSPVPMAIGAIVSARERARTRSGHAALGIGIGCIGLVCYVLLFFWIFFIALPRAM